MIYTEAATKVFRDFQGGNLEEVKNRAYKAGYEAFSFNGEIYVSLADQNAWIKTIFKIEDLTLRL